MRNALTAILLPVTIWLSACSRVPETPRLREAPQSNADALFIGSRLTAEDLKAIFRLLNEEGKFDGLRPLFDSPTAAELDDMAGLVSRYLYKEVDLESGLPELIRARAARSGFTALATDVDAWLKRPGSDAVIDLIVRVLDDASFVSLLSRDVGLFASGFQSAIETGLGAESVKLKHQWEARPPVDAGDLLCDLAALSRPDARERLIDLSRILERAGMGTALMKAVPGLRAFRNDVHVFEGVVYGLRGMLDACPDRESAPQSNKLELLFEFARQADSPTDKMFTIIEETLAEKPETIAILADLIRPVVSWSIRREFERRFQDQTFWDRALAQETSAKEIYKQSHRSVASIRGYHQSFEGVVDPFSENLRTELNAYALSLWWEHVIRANRAAIDALKEAGSLDRIWDMPVGRVDLAISFVKREGETVTFPQHDDMVKKEFFPDTLAKLEAYLEAGVVKDYPYSFTSPARSLREAFREALDHCDTILPLSDQRSFLIAVASYVSRPEKNIIGSFDSNNIMDSINRFAGSQPLDTVRRLKKLLFDEIGLGDFEWEGEKGVSSYLLPFFALHPDIMTKLQGLLESVAPFEDFDAPPAGHRDLATPFELYHRLLRNLPPGEAQSAAEVTPVHGLTRLLSFIAREGFFSRSAGDPSAWKFPGIVGLVNEATPLKRALEFASEISWRRPLPWKLSPAEELLEAATLVLGGDGGTESGMALHLDLLHRILPDHHAGLEVAVSRFLEKGLGVFPSNADITPDERDWLVGFVRRGDHERLWRFLHRHLDREKAHRLVSELIALQERGTLRHGFDLLGYISNTRIQRLSEILIAWNDGGELLAFLRSARDLLAEARRPPPRIPSRCVERAVGGQS